MMTEPRTVDRRQFLQTIATTAATSSLAFATSDSLFSQEKAVDLRRYEANLGDRLWMWGHGPNSTKGLYNIPEGRGIDMADAIRSMGIPNVCVVRWLGLPAPQDDRPDAPFDDYVRQFESVKRFAWSVIDGAPQSYEQKKSWAFDLCRKTKNLTGLFLDDFYLDSASPARETTSDGNAVAPAHLTLKQLEQLRNEAATLPRPVDLSVVLYSNQLDPSIKYHIDLCDIVSFWTWHATDLASLEENFKRYRQIAPTKRTLLGLYMWDFGNSRPITNELMTLQLDFALRQFQKGEIEGMIFHCTPLCDMDLEAVAVSRKWIEANRDAVPF